VTQFCHRYCRKAHSLFAQRLDLKGLSLIGEPTQIASNVSAQINTLRTGLPYLRTGSLFLRRICRLPVQFFVALGAQRDQIRVVIIALLAP